MEIGSKWLGAILIGAILLLVIAAFFFSPISQRLAPQQTELEDCKTLVYNGPEKINMLFFSTEENAEKYTDFLLTTEPFDKNEDLFNFFYIHPKTPLFRNSLNICAFSCI